MTKIIQMSAKSKFFIFPEISGVHCFVRWFEQGRQCTQKYTATVSIRSRTQYEQHALLSVYQQSKHLWRNRKIPLWQRTDLYTVTLQQTAKTECIILTKIGGRLKWRTSTSLFRYVIHSNCDVAICFTLTGWTTTSVTLQYSGQPCCKYNELSTITFVFLLPSTWTTKEFLTQRSFHETALRDFRCHRNTEPQQLFKPTVKSFILRTRFVSEPSCPVGYAQVGIGSITLSSVTSTCGLIIRQLYFFKIPVTNVGNSRRVLDNWPTLSPTPLPDVSVFDLFREHDQNMVKIKQNRLQTNNICFRST